MLSLKDIHDQIGNLDDRLEELVEQIVSAAVDAALAEATFKARFSQVRLDTRAAARTRQQKMTVDEVEDIATIATRTERQEYLIAANTMTTLREALRATQARMDGLRTMAASFRGAGG